MALSKNQFAFVTGLTVLLFHVSTLTAVTMPTSTTSAPAPPHITTLSPILHLYDKPTVIGIALPLMIGVPLLILACCLVRTLVAHRREKKIADEREAAKQATFHPAPVAPTKVNTHEPRISKPETVNDESENDDDEDDENFQHPAPNPPLPGKLGRRAGTIAGPFSNPVFDHDDDDEEEDSDIRSGVVTPSFVSTRVVEMPLQVRHKYIP